MDKRIKVLMVGPARDQQGGITTVINDYYKSGIEKRCDVKFLACTVNGSKLKKLIYGAKALLWECCHVRKFDVIHVHMGGGNSFARERFFVMVGVKAGIPTLLHVHDGFLRKTFESASRKLRNDYRRVFSSVDRVIVLSNSWKSYIEKYVTKSNNVIIIPNGVSIPENVNKNKTSGTILFLGHFDNNKNADVLIRAVALVRDIIPDVRCFFGADGDIDSAKQLIEKLKVEKECEILGWVDSQKKKELLDICSIYCIPSKNEAFPVGLLEAMANGLAPVVTPVGGMLDIIRDYETGIFVPVDDEIALKDVLICLLSDSVKRNQIALAASNDVATYFEINSIVDILVNEYKVMVDER